jgi:hypothetical protein
MKPDEQAHAAQVEDDDEAAFLVACVTVDTGPVGPVSTEVHLKEDKLFVQIGDKAAKCTHWILDTGAANYMTGNRLAFSELDTKVHGSVRFGDSSITGIEGCGTVLLKCKNGEHRALSMVYLIPHLTVNIVSLGQLEEDGHRILLFGGCLKIWDVKGRLMAKVDHGANWLYVLELNIARLVCLAVHGDSEAWRWHARFGHVNFKGMQQLAEGDMVTVASWGSSIDSHSQSWQATDHCVGWNWSTVISVGR